MLIVVYERIVSGINNCHDGIEDCTVCSEVRKHIHGSRLLTSAFLLLTPPWSRYHTRGHGYRSTFLLFVFVYYIPVKR